VSVRFRLVKAHVEASGAPTPVVSRASSFSTANGVHGAAECMSVLAVQNAVEQSDNSTSTCGTVSGSVRFFPVVSVS